MGGVDEPARIVISGELQVYVVLPFECDENVRRKQIAKYICHHQARKNRVPFQSGNLLRAILLLVFAAISDGLPWCRHAQTVHKDPYVFALKTPSCAKAHELGMKKVSCSLLKEIMEQKQLDIRKGV